MSVRDASHSFGWISILLHWVTAVLVVALWVIGDNISAATPSFVSQRLGLHVAIGASGYLLLWARIIWRLHAGHPHIQGHGKIVHHLSRVVHYLLLVALAGMLVSGPVLAWSSAVPVEVFGLFAVPSPIAVSSTVHEMAHVAHAFCAKAILWLVLIHVAGALKHLMLHGDETIARMLAPKRV